MLFFVKLNQEFSSNLSIVFIFVSCEEKGYYRVVSAAQLSFDFQSYSERSRRMQGRGIKWSLRAFASMRAVRLFLRARAVISFVMRAASTLEFTNMASNEHLYMSRQLESLFIKTLFCAK